MDLGSKFILLPFITDYLSLFGWLSNFHSIMNKILEWFGKEKFERALWTNERIQYSKRKTENLKRRIKEKAHNFTGAINNLMLFSLIYFNIDITPKSFT